MSLHRRNPRRDANEGDICEALASVGAEYWKLSGKGLPDVLVRFRGRLHAAEIKTLKGRLTKHQGAFPVWRTADEALAAIGAIRA